MINVDLLHDVATKLNYCSGSEYFSLRKQSVQYERNGKNILIGYLSFVAPGPGYYLTIVEAVIQKERAWRENEIRFLWSTNGGDKLSIMTADDNVLECLILNEVKSLHGVSNETITGSN